MKKLLKIKSIRHKILVTVFSTIFLLSINLIVTSRIDHYALNTLGDSYKSNAQLNKLATSLENTERAMEKFIRFYSFENIDYYYLCKNAIDELSNQMNATPSADEVKQEEYKIVQLTRSFSSYSLKVVSARRANNSTEQDFYYQKTMNCYNLLLREIADFNVLSLNHNSVSYLKNKNFIRVLTNSIYLFFILFFVLIILFLRKTLSDITEPLSDISEAAGMIADGNFDVPLFNSKSEDEVGKICRAFDKMTVSIREYIETIWEKARSENELKEKQIEMNALYTKAKLEALQSQINPHFLFNTLNTGVQLAMMEGADRTCEFIEQTADFFRYIISSSRKSATISDEFKLVDNFVYIMKVRFGQRLIFLKEIPEQQYLQNIPVMTIQPLVENCIKHGLENSTGIVTLKAEEIENFLVISVSDNGKGFDSEIKSKIFEAVKNQQNGIYDKSDEKNKDHNGIGLISVISRLQLHFKRDDIFEILDNEGNSGTKFVIKVPLDV